MFTPEAFVEARYGLFLHYGLYSILGRGEWVLNREEIPLDDYRALAEQFDPSAFNADAIARFAKECGMRYLVFTTMHHDGFRLYESALSDYSSVARGSRRDLTAEIIAAARCHGLGIGLYHSLNNWNDQPDAVDALESPQARERFLEATFARLRELLTRYQPIDLLWYDGWWPFDAEGWRAEAMNAMVREIQPGLLVNGRNGLPGDFATPEQHLAAPQPWRPWEACVTLNDHWGFHAGDHHWKQPREVIALLARVAQHRGNLLLNIGLQADGSIPPDAAAILRRTGEWLQTNGEAIFGTDLWTIDPYQRGEHRGDWTFHGPLTVRGPHLYQIVATPPPGDELVITGLESRVREVVLLGNGPVPFTLVNGRLGIAQERAPKEAGALPAVYRITCETPPVIYKTGGMRLPAVTHPRYDPLPSDIAW